MMSGEWGIKEFHGSTIPADKNEAIFIEDHTACECVAQRYGVSGDREANA
jgi:hypothetical protein